MGQDGKLLYIPYQVLSSTWDHFAQSLISSRFPLRKRKVAQGDANIDHLQIQFSLVAEAFAPFQMQIIYIVLEKY